LLNKKGYYAEMYEKQLLEENSWTKSAKIQKKTDICSQYYWKPTE
jgi:hypothetical protein